MPVREPEQLIIEWCPNPQFTEDVDVSHALPPPPAPESRVVYRHADVADAGFLLQMLAVAFNWREDPDFDRSLLEHPQVAHYLTDWPTETDFGVIAECGALPAGAAWARYFTNGDPGYGYVSDTIAEISIAVAQGYRGQGIGHGLLERLIHTAQRLGLDSLSLSVEDDNAARRLYERVGFTVVGREGNSDTMTLTLNRPRS